MLPYLDYLQIDMNRRQFLAYSTGFILGSSLSWKTHQYLHTPSIVTLDKIGLPLAHALRDGKISLQTVSTHHCNTLILGSGAAALSAAWYLVRHNYHDFLLAEGFERNGNNAAIQFNHTLNAPTGAHYLPQPSSESVYVRQMLQDLGIIIGKDAQNQPIYQEEDLVHAPDERLLYQGKWQEGLLPDYDKDSQRFFTYIEELRHAIGTDGRQYFAIPIRESSLDMQYLDTLTFAQWLSKEGYHSPRLLWYLDYCCRDDYGQGSASVSAFAGLHYFAARGNERAAVLTWPDGLSQLSERLRHFCHIQELTHFPTNHAQWTFTHPVSIPAIATKIQEHDTGVDVYLRHTKTGETRLIHAQNVICATPIHIAQKIIHQAERYHLHAPAYAPWLISNFVLSAFPAEIKQHELAWDNVIYGSQGLGYVVATHQQIRVAKPPNTVFTAYHALAHDTPQNIRQWLLNTQAKDLLPYATQDLFSAYGSSFMRYVSQLHMTVRAHAMAIPTVGYLQRPFAQSSERLLFAHSDLSGYSVFEEACYWGVQAAKKIIN